mgnify:CR=1 FL=1
MRTLYLILFATFLLMTSTSCKPEQTGSPVETDWKEILQEDLHLLGHRNWVLVVDKAFPEQSSPGMKYLYVEQDLLPTLEEVLQALDGSTHVVPVIYQDKELSFITEEQVKGIEQFRTRAAGILEGRGVQTLLHDEVFGMLDESSSLFRVLVIKTNCTLPYTSVFMQLDCSYWGPEQEEILREKMSAAP